MIRRSLAILAALFFVAAPLSLQAADSLTYPPAARSEVTDDYFGTKVADPYRWMEEIDSPQTRAWVQAEAALTNSYLSQLPHRDAIRNRLMALANYEKTTLPTHERNTYILSKNSGLQNHSVVYVSDGPDGPWRTLLDPNALSTDGTVALGGGSLSRDGKLYAYSTQTAGSDWQTWHVRDVASGNDLSDRIEWAKFSGASWNGDSTGFYYSAYDKPADSKLNIVNYNQKVYFHKVGTAQSADWLVYARPDRKELFLTGRALEDSQYLIISAGSGHTNGVYVLPEWRGNAAPVKEAVSDVYKVEPRELFAPGKASYSIVSADGPTLFVETNDGAPNSRLIAVDANDPAKVRVVIPESDVSLQGVSSAGGRFFARYLKDAYTLVRVYDRGGTLEREVTLPGIGTASGFGGRRDDTAVYYSFAGYTTPPTIYRYDIASGTSTVYSRPKVAFDPNAFTTEQIFFTSKDGTRVPMFLSYKKGLVKNGSNPTILYGYGGFRISETPRFSSSYIGWMEMGGIFADVVLRGGTEYGEAWHKAGMLANKQNVFDDFIGAAQKLIADKYTSTPRLAVKGGSNGGLLVAATELERPELFGAVIANVGVMDMLRYQKFTVGNAWIPEYGSAEANAEQFKTLYAYSPVHNVKPGTKYPPTLISTGDHDDRVFPAHSFKLAAEMQRDQAGSAPVLLFVELNAGHGGGKPLAKALNEIADEFSFLTKALAFTPPAL